MTKPPLAWLLSCLRTVCAVLCVFARAFLFGFMVAFCQPVFAQVDRQATLEIEPLVKVDVQSLKVPQEKLYSNPNRLLLSPSEMVEDPLSFYVRTQDGEWQIPVQVDREDPWVRLLLLGPVRPTIIEVAIEIDQKPFRAARELWIDKLLTEAKASLTTTPESSNVLAKEALSEAKPTDDTAEIPMVSPRNRQPRSVLKRLIHYLAADPSIAEHATSREELRWLLAEWTGGPALLTLSPAFAWRRAEVAPLWHALDRNGDQRLSREEIQQTSAMFKQADINQDDIVDLSELQRISELQRPSKSQEFGKEPSQDTRTSAERTKGHPLVLVIDESTDWKALQSNLHNAYQQQGAYRQQGQATPEMPLRERLGHGDRSLSTADLVDLLFLPADVVVRVSFATKEDAKKDLFALLKIDNATDVCWRLRSSTEQVIAVEYQKTQRQNISLELSAAQSQGNSANASDDSKQTQIAIGAVADGYPLFRQLDYDNNRQLSLREQRSTQKLLKALDRNQDGQLDPLEKPIAMRLAITHGPQVHQHLAQPVAAQQERSNLAEIKAPAWFVGMDRNRDGDLSKREFQGSPAQFAKFDQDNDGLISRQEVR